MNNFKTLFLKDFPEIVTSLEKSDLSSGYALIQILHNLLSQNQIMLPVRLTQKLQKRLFKPSTEIQLDKNWIFIEEVFKSGNFELDSPTIENIKKQNETVMTSFGYQFFNFIDVLKYSKAKISSGLKTFQSTNFEKLEKIKFLNDCEQIFEKLIFLLAKSMDTTILNAS